MHARVLEAEARAQAAEAQARAAEARAHAAVVKARRAEEAAWEAEVRASDAQGGLELWEKLISRLLVIVALGPRMTELYKRTLVKELRKALESLPMVESVGNLQCSFPAVPTEAPRLRIQHWGGRLSQPIQWDVEWRSASWSVTLSVAGRLYGVGFSLGVQLHHFGIRGRLGTTFPSGDRGDLSEARLCFSEVPQVDFVLDSTVACGFVPLPVRSQVDAKVRSALTQVLIKEMVAPNQVTLRIAALRPKQGLTDHDVQQATEDAELAKQRLDGRAARAISGG